MSSPRKTPLYNLHIESGARMVAFAGYEMPIQYKKGIIHEHLYTRSHAGLFDISHMGQIRISGEQATAELERLTPSDITGIKLGRQKYTVLTNDEGGIIDDLMVTNWGDSLLLIVNAACKDKDFSWLQNSCTEQVTLKSLDNHSLLALQGPAAAKILLEVAPETAKLSFLQACQVKIDRFFCQISRSGYTGEDGFEISVGSEHAEQLARLLLAYEDVELIGLGARDTLRLEAGLCLYGHDLDETITPSEAGLGWIMKPGHHSYPGVEKVLLPRIRQRKGIQVLGKIPVRAGATLTDSAGNRVGNVTSGSYGPTAGMPIAMGYINNEHANVGNQLIAQVRNKEIPVTIVRLPFVPHQYHR